jgi:tripeptide aminopeptidase
MIEAELRALGLTVTRDEVGPQCGSDGWNVYAHLPGEGEPILFSSHFDTVPPGVGIRAVVEDGVIRSAGDTVLGADAKAGIAAVIEALTVIREGGGPHRPVEVLFTVCEELGLLGAKYADYSQIQSREAVVLDSNIVGEMINQGPAKFTVRVEIRGKSAHAALAPDRGINAVKAAALAIANIPTGFVGEGAVMNVANFLAPGKSNVVPDRASFEIDMRALDLERLEAHLQHVQTAVQEACASIGATWEITVDRQTEPMFVPPSRPLVTRLTRVYEALGISAKLEKTFGGSDATWLFTHGLDVINIGTGMMDVHSTDEYITVADLLTTAKVVHFMMLPEKACSPRGAKSRTQGAF